MSNKDVPVTENEDIQVQPLEDGPKVIMGVVVELKDDGRTYFTPLTNSEGVPSTFDEMEQLLTDAARHVTKFNIEKSVMQAINERLKG